MSLLRELLRRLTWRLALFWLLLAGGAWLFKELADAVYGEQGFAFDEPVLAWFYERRGEAWTDVMFAVSVLGDVPATVLAAVLLLAALVAWLRREALFFALALGGASGIMVLTKEYVDRARPDLFPDGSLYPTASASFPSGHATGSAALWLTLFLIARRHAPGRAWLVGVVGLAWTLTVAVSRLYLGVHFPSDVLAGLALGVAWVLGVQALLVRDRASRFVLLRLPTGLAEELHARAGERGVAVDALAAEALRAGLEPAPGPAPPEGRPGRPAGPRGGG